MHFAFSIDIIANIITFSLSSPDYVTRTSTNGSAVSLSRVSGCITWPVGCVFVEYDLFNTTNLIQNLIYIHFGIILTQFYINFSRQEHQIDVLYVPFNAWDYQVSSYTPFHFFFTVTVNSKHKLPSEMCYSKKLLSIQHTKK